MSTSEPIFAVCRLVSDQRYYIEGRLISSHFKGDVIVTNADFELLFSDNVLFWPIRVVFPLYLISYRIPTAFDGLRTL